jgi:hypothetical protein
MKTKWIERCEAAEADAHIDQVDGKNKSTKKGNY